MAKRKRAIDDSCLKKLQAVRSELDAALHERTNEVDGILTALLSGEHMLLLGPPGSAKSLLARLACEAVDGARFFEWLLTKFSTPEELFGPMSLKGLEQDEYRRITRNKLPEAHVAFLDEVFKANSAILNSLLAVINERVYHNNGAPMRCPLVSVVGSSNELPGGDSDREAASELDALYDRFMLRFWTSWVDDRDAQKELYFATDEPSISTSITLDELFWLQKKVATVKVPDEIQEAILTIKSELARDGIVCSDRRWKKSVKVLRAYAVLNGHDLVEEDDLLFLVNMLWREPDQRTAVREKVGQVASPLTAEALSIWDAAKEAHAALLKIEGSPEFLVQAVEVRAMLKEMRQRLDEGVRSTRGSATRATTVLEQLRGLQADVKRRADRALD